MSSDDVGTKYVTSHRCFGKTCKEAPVLKYEVRNYTPSKASFVQLAAEQLPGHFEEERDNELGYPTDWTVQQLKDKKDEDLQDFVHEYIE